MSHGPSRQKVDRLLPRAASACRRRRRGRRSKGFGLCRSNCRPVERTCSAETAALVLPDHCHRSCRRNALARLCLSGLRAARRFRPAARRSASGCFDLQPDPAAFLHAVLPEPAVCAAAEANGFALMCGRFTRLYRAGRAEWLGFTDTIGGGGTSVTDRQADSPPAHCHFRF